MESRFSRTTFRPYCEDTEFTVCVLESHQGHPVALIPLEINIGNEVGRLLDYRKNTSLLRKHATTALLGFQKKKSCRFETSQSFFLKNLASVTLHAWMVGSQKQEKSFSLILTLSAEWSKIRFLFQQTAKVEMSHTDLINMF